MSHFTDIDIGIRDVEALKATCAELGLPVEQNTTARGYGGNLHRGEYVVAPTR